MELLLPLEGAFEANITDDSSHVASLSSTPPTTVADEASIHSASPKQDVVHVALDVEPIEILPITATSTPISRPVESLIEPVEPSEPLSNLVRPRRSRVSAPVYNLVKLSGTAGHGKRRANGDIVSNRRRRRRTLPGTIATDEPISPVEDEAAIINRTTQNGLEALDLRQNATQSNPLQTRSHTDLETPVSTRRSSRKSMPHVPFTETPQKATPKSGKRNGKAAEKASPPMSRELRRLQDTKEFAHVDDRPVLESIWSNGKWVDPKAPPAPKVNQKRTAEDKPEKEDEEEDEEEEDDEDVKVDDDEIVQRELRRAHEKHDPARGGGFSSSESDSDDSDDSDEDEADAAVDIEGDMQRFQDEQANVETGEVTNRIAIVNLDWDHVRSTDLMALFSSFLYDTGGKIENVAVYPSEFGKERMQQEEVEGPPKALFKNPKNDSDDSDEDSDDEDERIKKGLLEEGDDQDFDSDALRSYQLDRLRYYYAVMTCSSPEVAHKIYEATDGREYQSSSNFLDLRFVPDEVTFDDEPRDQCDKVPDTYKPVEFVTNALQSSKVKLTWDLHPEEASRKASINRAFSGSRSEIEENDLRAYLASDSEDDDDVEEEAEVEVVEDEVTTVPEGERKLSKKELARQKMRAALGLTEEPASKVTKGGPVGDMQITFTPALTEGAPKKKEAEEETTIEKYVRKEKERKEQKRQASRAKREGAAAEEDVEETAAPAGGDDDLGFDDPFFTADGPAPTSKTSVRKEERRKKREARDAAEAESAIQKEQLKKAMAKGSNDASQADHLDHFDMNEIMRAEKQKRKKAKDRKIKESQGGLQEGFDMPVADDRFKAVFESHEYAIDPSNPKFKATEGMKKLLEEGRKKRRGDDEAEEPRTKKVKKGRR